LAFPTAEEVARYYTSEEEILVVLGGILTPENIVALDTKLLLVITDGMQDEKIVHEQMVESLPLPPDHDVFTPPPKLYQSVKKPPYRKMVLDPQFPFSFLTKPEGNLASPNSPKSVASTATKGSAAPKGKPPPKPGPKATAAAGTVSELTPHTVLPPGYVKKTRWVIPGYEKLDLALLFWSRNIEEFEHTFKFWDGKATQPYKLKVFVMYLAFYFGMLHIQAGNSAFLLVMEFPQNTHVFCSKSSTNLSTLDPSTLHRCRMGFLKYRTRSIATGLTLKTSGSSTSTWTFSLCKMLGHPPRRLRIKVRLRLRRKEVNPNRQKKA
jgi:hypothetical protein